MNILTYSRQMVCQLADSFRHDFLLYPWCTCSKHPRRNVRTRIYQLGSQKMPQFFSLPWNFKKGIPGTASTVGQESSVWVQENK